MTCGVKTSHSRGYRRRQAAEIAKLPADQQQGAYEQIRRDESRRRKSLINFHTALMKSRSS